MNRQCTVRSGLGRVLLIGVASFCLHGVASAQWRAFNCFGHSGAHPNDTFYTVSGWGIAAGPMINIDTGESLPVGLAITNLGTMEGVYPLSAPPAGTPAYAIFNGYVSWGDNSGAWADHFRLYDANAVGYCFTGLDPQKRYRFAGTVVRAGQPDGGAPNYFSNRWTRVELTGASDSVAAHSAGVITAEDFPADLTGTQAAFNSGVNTSGQVVAWDGIAPDANGSFTIIVRKYSGHIVKGSSSATASATFAYALSQIELEETQPNQQLSIRMVSPTDGQTLEACAPAGVSLALTGSPVEVSYYADNTLFTNRVGSPWAPVTLPPLAPGPHAVYATAVDGGGTRAYTATNTINVSGEMAANFTRGPLVQNVSTSGLQIIWRTPVPGTSFVIYGPTNDATRFRIGNAEMDINHVITIGNLEPDTVYSYSVGSDLGCGVVTSPAETFRTLKGRGSVRFVVVSDTAGTDTRAVAMRAAVAAVMCHQGADLAMHVGDSVYTGFDDTGVGAEFFGPFQALIKNVPIFNVAGNHDVYQEPQALNYQSAFYLPTNTATGTEMFYSFDHGDAHFVSLYNPWFYTYVPQVGDTQYGWLTNDLARTTKPWKLVFMHSALASSSYHAPDDLDGSGRADKAEFMDLFLPVAQRYGVQMVFGGHDHVFERFAPTNGLHHVVAGGGGQNLYGMYYQHVASAQLWPVHHCLVVSVTNDTLSVQALDTNGVVFDGMTVQKALPSPQLCRSTWHSPAIETAAANNGDGNIVGQRFDFAGTPIYPRAGQFSNLGRVYVNNDASNLYIGFEQLMFYQDNNVFLFVASPRLTGRTSMAGVGNGRVDPEGQGVDGLDCLENLCFSNFAPSLGCVLGDECADGQFRSFLRPGLMLNIGQGVFRLDTDLGNVPGARLQQFNHSPETIAGVPYETGQSGEQNADFIEVAIPFAALGNVLPGETVKLGAVVGGAAFDPVAQTRQLDTSVLGASLSGSGERGYVLEGLSVRLATDPSAPSLVISAAGPDGFLLCWNAQVGKKYDIESSSDLKSFASIGAVGLPLTASSTTASFMIKPGAGAAVFYRVRETP